MHYAMVDIVPFREIHWYSTVEKTTMDPEAHSYEVHSEDAKDHIHV